MYGTFNGETAVKFNGVTTLPGLAKATLRVAMTEEGYELTKDSTKAYLESWVETMVECGDGDDTEYTIADAIDQAASNICYSRDFFIDFRDNTQLSSADREVVFNEMVKLLEIGA